MIAAVKHFGERGAITYVTSCKAFNIFRLLIASTAYYATVFHVLKLCCIYITELHHERTLCIATSARSFAVRIPDTTVAFPFGWAILFPVLPSLKIFLPSFLRDSDGILNTLSPSTPSGKCFTDSAFIPDHISSVIFLCFCFVSKAESSKSSSSPSL